MGNPDVSGLGPNWYLGGGWPSGTIATTSSAYQTALSDLQAKASAYLAAKDALQTAMLGTSQSAVSSAKTAFDTAAANLKTSLTNMQTKTASLANAQVSAETNIDGKLDNNMSQFAQDLAGVMNQQLTLPQTVSSDLDTQFAAADANRVSLRSTYFSAISAYFSSQNSLNTERTNFQDLSDDLLSLQAQKKIDELAAVPNPATIAADQAAIDAKQAQVNTSSSQISILQSTRDANLTALQGASTAYTGALDAEIALLNQAALLMHTTATGFLEALQSAKEGALQTAQAALNASQAADQALFNDLLTGFPTSNTSVNTQTQIIQNAYLLTMNQINSSTLAQAPNLTQITAPALPAAGQMSISQLMQFLTLVQVLLDELIREIRRTDSQVNQLRLSIFGASGSVDASKATTQAIWGNIIAAADAAYNAQVANDNAAASRASVDATNYIKSHAALINSYITQMNSDIDDQNSRGVQTVTDLNSSVQMAIDEYKVNLWADHGTLDDFQNQLLTSATNLGTSDPLKAPLTTVSGNAQTVINDLKTISGLLSVRPIDETAIAAAKTQLTADLATLNSNISGLPAQDASIQSVLSGLTGAITSVTSDQTKLFNAIHSAEASAASALKTQVSSESTRLTGYSQDLTTVLSSLSPTNSSFAALTAYNAAIPAVAGALNTLSTDLAASPVNLATIATDQAALDTALASLATARAGIVLSGLNGPALDAVKGGDGVVADIQETEISLTTYTTSTSSATSIPPNLPSQVQQVLMPPPTQLEHLTTINAGSITIPSGLPLKGINTSKPAVTQAPPKVNTTSVDALNKEIDQLNQQLAPVLDKLHADGHTDITLIPPLYIRPYVTIRDPSVFLDYAVFDSLFNLLSQIIDSELSANSSVENPPTNALFSFSDLLGKPNVTADGTIAQGVGAGTGIGGANLSSSAGTIAQSLSAVLSTTDFANYVQGILQRTGVVAGLAALGKLQTAPTVRSQFGIVERGTTPTQPAGLSADQQKAAVKSAVTELIATVENVPALKDDILALLKAANLQNLDQDAINQLQALLIFLLQLVALLFAALAEAAAGGETNIDRVVQKAFGTTEEQPLATATQNLRTLGVANIPQEITPSNPEFLKTFFNAIEPVLLSEERAPIVSNITALFTDRGIKLPTGVPLGTAIQTALNEAPVDVATKIRQALTKNALDEAERLKNALIADDRRRPTFSQRISQIAGEPKFQLPPEQVNEVANVLQNAAPKIQGLSAEDRNHLVLALLSGIVTPDQAHGIVQEFLKEGALKTNAPIANLLQTQTGRPGELPDVKALITTALKALTKQTSDTNFLQEVVSRFADSVRDQSDFFQKSLSLILNPANTYVKNFSIVTRQTTDHDSLGPLTQIPVSG